MNARYVGVAALLPLTLFGCRGLAGFDDVEPIAEEAGSKPGDPCGEDKRGTYNNALACMGPGMELATMLAHTCLRTYDGEVWCWGCTQDRFEIDTHWFSATPQRVEGLPAIKTIALGYSHACALTTAGRIFCWGDNAAGQLGVDATPDPYLVPEEVPSLDGLAIKELSLGRGHSCAESELGAHCWGLNAHGQCGVASQTLVAPSSVPVVDDVYELEAMKDRTCVIRESTQELQCWGQNEHGALQDGGGGYEPVTMSLPGDNRVTDMGLNWASTYALSHADGLLYAWGRNHVGQLGIGDGTPDVVPKPSVVLTETQAPLDEVLSVFSTQGSAQCASLDPASSIEHPYACWGANNHGVLGYGEGGERDYVAHAAVRIPAEAEQLVIGTDHACVLLPPDPAAGRPSDEVWCWGRDRSVGDGTATICKGEQVTKELAPVLWR